MLVPASTLNSFDHVSAGTMTIEGVTVSQTAPKEETGSGLEPGAFTLRQAADALGTSTTTLRKMIRQGRLPEAEKVKTADGRVWSIPAASIPGIAARAGFAVTIADAIDLREPETDLSVEEVLVDPAELDNAIHLDDSRREDGRLESWRLEPVPSETIEIDLDSEPMATPLGRSDAAPAESEVSESVDVDSETGTAIESIGAEAAIEPVESAAPTLSDVLDTALLEKLLGAKEAETVALVKAERQRSEYDALAARQLEIEQRYADADLQRSALAEQLHKEALARAISDARVTELRDQLQREITYAEAERYERRQALARETKATAEAAEIRAALGWRARRKLRRAD